MWADARTHADMTAVERHRTPTKTELRRTKSGIEQSKESRGGRVATDDWINYALPFDTVRRTEAHGPLGSLHERVDFTAFDGLLPVCQLRRQH